MFSYSTDTIVESGVKHHKPNLLSARCVNMV